MKLTGKKALITGGNSGIGLATACLFVAEGAEIAIIGRDQKTLDEAVAELGPQARRTWRDFLRLRKRPGECVSACGGRPRRAREAHRAARRELARLVRRLHGG